MIGLVNAARVEASVAVSFSTLVLLGYLGLPPRHIETNKDNE
jgi:hypothetical protein